jgi:hypothetical protein
MQTKLVTLSQFIGKPSSGVSEKVNFSGELDSHLVGGWKVLSQSSATFGTSATGAYLCVSFLLGK